MRGSTKEPICSVLHRLLHVLGNTVADDQHCAILMQGVKEWNGWRSDNNAVRPQLSKVNLAGKSLDGVNLGGANMQHAILAHANLSRADFSGANLYGAILEGAKLSRSSFIEAGLSGAIPSAARLDRANLRLATLSEASLVKADLTESNLYAARLSSADLRHANLSRANLPEANLTLADLQYADLSAANLRGAGLFGANLSGAKLHRADATGANLTRTALVETDMSFANLTGCRVYGTSVWNPILHNTRQNNIFINKEGEPEITVDNLEVAQFIYLLLHDKKIRHAIDTITTKVVLILGNFSDERKRVLDAMRDELRNHDYVPVLFDFSKPNTLTYEETITLLARMARFIIADVTEAKEIRAELTSIAQQLPSVPVRPLLLAGAEEWSTFEANFRNRRSVLSLHRYQDTVELINNILRDVVEPAETLSKELRRV